MILFSSIWAVSLRHLRVFKRDVNFFLMSMYWPILDILIWGFLGSWIQKSQQVQLYNYETVALLGILLWQIVGRGCNQMMFSLTEEFMPNNIVNLFSLPLQTIEWMLGTVLFAVIMMCATTFFSLVVIYFLYKVSISYLFSIFLIFALPMFLSCIWLGFTCLSVVITLGRRGIEIGFVIGWFLMPFSGAFYPIDVLPGWARLLSACLPMSYVFQGMRNYVMYNQDPTYYFILSIFLSTIYAISAILLFIYCFNRSKLRGLSRLAE